MHSSRMRPALLLTVSRSIWGGGVCLGVVCLEGVSARGDVCLGGSAQRVCVSQHAMGQTPP